MNRLRIGLAFGGLVLIGVGGSAAGVLLPYQMADYHIDKIGVGLLFFAYSGGYVLSGVANGPLIHRLGTRAQLPPSAAPLLAARPRFARPQYNRDESITLGHVNL